MADMKPGVPWSVKGIEPQAREAAKDAARRAGLTLGEWLNRMILDQDGDPDPGQPAAARPPSHELASRLDALNRRLDRLGDERTAADASGLADPRRAQRSPPDDHAAATDRAAERLERTDAMIRSLQREVHEIAGRIGAAAPANHAGVEAVERALFEVVDHIELSDKRNADVLKTIQQRLSDLAGRVQQASGQIEDRESRAAIVELEQRLGELTRKLERARSGELRVDPSAFEQKLSDLAAKVDRALHNPAIDALEARLNQVTSKLSATERVMTPQTEFNQVKSELGKLKSEIARAGEAVRPTVVHAIEARLKNLDAELSGIRSNAASMKDVRDLGQRLDEVSSRMNTSEQALRSAERIGSFEERLNKISQKLESSPPAAGPHPGITALEDRVNEIAERLAGRTDQAGAAPAITRLESQINDIAARLARTEGKFEALETIERSLSEIFGSIEASRRAAIDAAERAAGEAVRNLSANAAEPGEIATADALTALERGLAEVKSHAASAEKHNQDTLEAIHDTLKRVIERLGKLELAGTTARGARSAGAFDWSPGRRLSPAIASEAEEPGEDFDDFRLPPLPEADGPDETRPAADGPAPAPAENSRSADLDGAAAAAQFARAYDSPPPAVSRNEDFIAAARQAARAAAEAQDGLDPAPEGGNSNLSPTRSLISRFRGRKRALLFVAAGLLIAAGALSLSGGLNPLGPASGGKPGVPERASSYAIPPAADAATLAEPSREDDADQANILGPATPGDPATPNTDPVDLTPSRAAATDPSDRGSDTPAGLTPIITIAPTEEPGGETVLSPRIAKTAEPARAETDRDRAAADAPAADEGTPGARSADIPLTAMAITVEPETRSLAAGAGPGPASAPRTLTEAAEAGDAIAQFEIAARHADGRGGRTDLGAAAEWYQRAAAQGLAPAQYRLGALYEKGQGVPQDLSAARIWYQRAAEQGNVKAMHNLAVLLAGASNGNADYARAARWFLEAAELGLADSQFNLAVLHERGLGIQRDPGAAYKWYAVAAAKGDAEAEKRMGALAGKLDPATLARASAAYQSWRAAPLDQTANFVAVPEHDEHDEPATGSGPTASIDTLVARAQQLLAELGYDPGPADGVAGPRTSDAIAAFERDRGLPETGAASPEVVEQLLSATSG